MTTTAPRQPQQPPATAPIGELGKIVEDLSAVDAPGKKIAKAVRGAIKPGAVKDLISGTWLGHALHPLLTDVVIGAWTSANLLDVLGGRESRAASEKLIAVGIAAYGPTALTGVSDWADSEPIGEGIRRVGVVHALTNGTALALYTASLRARRNGDHGKGVALAAAGAGLLGAGGYLGSHLIARQGVGVDQTAFDPAPDDEWTQAIASTELTTEPASVQVGDTPVLLVRREQGIAALHDRCSHRGCSLASGTLDSAGDVIECGCHGSRFRLGDGAVVRGPATAHQPVFEARERDGRVEVRAPQ
jgi:nitrite reductase/ring-hydroxylating ferredoxin subunit